VVWWCGGVVVWWYGGMVVWWCGGMVVWWCGGMVVWWYGGMVVWWYGGMVVAFCWYGSMVVWWCGGGGFLLGLVTIINTRPPQLSSLLFTPLPFTHPVQHAGFALLFDTEALRYRSLH